MYIKKVKSRKLLRKLSRTKVTTGMAQQVLYLLNRLIEAPIIGTIDTDINYFVIIEYMQKV